MRQRWHKALIIAADVVLAAYIVLAFTAFNKPDETQFKCREVNINIMDDNANGFITPTAIKSRLLEANLYPIGKPMSRVEGRHIEEVLMRSPFVKSAKVRKTQSGKVFIDVTQLLPVIRVKTDTGDDYYIDDKNTVMPNSSYISDLIVATGHISRGYATAYLGPLGRTIMANEFWRNLFVQINILPDKGVELVPRIGDHIVYLGRLPETDKAEKRDKMIADFVKKKLTRLEKFYRYGLSVAGWNKYSYINVEFDNQIVCRKADTDKVKAAPPVVATDTTTVAKQPQPQPDGNNAPAATQPTKQDNQKKNNKEQQNKKT